MCPQLIGASSAIEACYPRALAAAFPYWKNSYRKLPKFARRFVPTFDGLRAWPSSFWMVRVWFFPGQFDRYLAKLW